MGCNKPNAAVCIPSLQRNINIVEIPTQNSFEFNKDLQANFHILEYVFQFLDMDDLQTVKSVNSIWRNLGKQELQKRLSTSWISCSFNSSLCNMATNPEFKYNNKSLCIIAYSWKIIDLNKYVFLQLNNFNSDFHRMLFADYVHKEIVPKDIDYCIIPSRRVFNSNIENKCETILYQGIFLPDIPKIKTTMFYCNPQNIDYLPEFTNSKQIKCLLMFTPTYQFKITNIFLTALLKGQNPSTIAVGGGLVKLISTSTKANLETENSPEDILCIVFQQTESDEIDFNAYSVVIVSDGPQSFENEVIKLKNATNLRKYGIVFRFSCLLANYNKTVIIEKHFPNYPLLGFVVDMQIGWNSLSTQEQESDTEAEGPSKPKKCKVEVPNSWHNESLVLVVITWGKKL